MQVKEEFKRKNHLIKQDINWLEYPLWMTDERNKVKEFKIENEKGSYLMKTSADQLPTRVDRIILNYLIHELDKQTNFENEYIFLSRYRIAENVLSKKPGSKDYNRIDLALERLSEITIYFSNLFYEGREENKKIYSSEKIFHIIDNVKKITDIKNNAEILKIRFNEEFVGQLRNSPYITFTDMETMLKLKRPTSLRLYEILIKTFLKREKWKIGIKKLATKLTLNSDTPSHLFKIINSAAIELNKEWEIKLDYDTERKICTFTRPAVPDPKIQKLLHMLPEILQNMEKVHKLLDNALKKYGYKYVESNITYHLSKARDRQNYSFLEMSIKNDYGQKIRAEKEVEKKQVKHEKEKEKQKDLLEKKKEKEQNDKHKELLDYFKSLSIAKQHEIQSQIDQNLSVELYRDAYMKYKETGNSAMGESLYFQELYSILNEIIQGENIGE